MIVATPIPRCHTAELRVTLGREGVGLGNAERPVYFRNVGRHVCFVYGYAGFGLEDAQHRVQRSQVHWGPTYFGGYWKKRRVVLRPGQSARTILAWGHVSGPGENQYQCEPISEWLEVTPPDERTFVRVRFHDTVCGHGFMSSPPLRAG